MYNDDSLVMLHLFFPPLLILNEREGALEASFLYIDMSA